MMATKLSPDAGKRYGRRLAELRRDRGFTQAELAERAGLSLSTIADLERGRRLVPKLAMEIAQKLARALAVRMDALLEEPDDPSPPQKGRPTVSQ